MSTRTINITPDTHMIDSIRNQSMTYWKAIAEIIDNAINAGASVVNVNVSSSHIEFSDNGHGVDSMESLIGYGDHRPTQANRIGKYGVGFKDASIQIGDRVEVTSSCNGHLSTIQFDWKEIEESGKWEIELGEAKPTSRSSGTSIKLFYHPSRKAPDRRVRSKIEWAYSGGIENGLTINWSAGKRNVKLSPCSLPPLSHVEEKRVIFDGGRTADLMFGITDSGATMQGGPCWIRYEHRNVADENYGYLSANSRSVVGIVTLSKEWRLDKWKSAVTDEYADALWDEVNQHVAGMVDSVMDDALVFECAELMAQVSSELGSIIDDRGRAKRDKSNHLKDGTEQPKGTDRKVHEARDVHKDKTKQVVKRSGKGSSRRPAFSVVIGACKEGTFGNHTWGSNRAVLNEAIPCIQFAKESRNAEALKAYAVMVVSDYISDHKKEQKLLPGCEEMSGMEIAYKLVSGMSIEEVANA